MTIDRRAALGLMGAGTLGIAGGSRVTPDMLARFRALLARGNYRALFFTDAEMATLRVLGDMIIPADDRSGAASSANTAEYVDFVLSESGTETQRAWREGLAWLDAECGRRFNRVRFVECTDQERGLLLDDIAWPARARAELRSQAEWFNRVRDLVGSGFFSSAIGVQDIGYIGGVFNPGWRGAPEAALRELGVDYQEWDRRYGGQQ